jgi:N-dimethylarginine dimethylaminohydrolase
MFIFSLLLTDTKRAKKKSVRGAAFLVVTAKIEAISCGGGGRLE